LRLSSIRAGESNDRINPSLIDLGMP
jgi:hypothetical protein